MSAFSFSLSRFPKKGINVSATILTIDHKSVRLFLLGLLLVGSLQITRCGGSPDVESAAQDQYDRMYN